MILCIYHGNCADGFGAAWAVRAALGDQVEFHPGVYQDPPPDVTGRDVVMVDFSYKRPVLEEMGSKAQSLLILDHHKSAFEDLCDFEKPAENWESHYTEVLGSLDPMQWTFRPFVRALFDMDRSGAGITWDFFHDATRPPLIDHIEDRDLWRFALPGTREIQAAVFSHPYDFDLWNGLMHSNLEDLRREGEAIERKHFKDIKELLGVTQRRMVIGGHDVPVANLPYTLTSDAGHKMAQGEPFAACYWDTPEGRVFSLRSADDGLDVSEIAGNYGGGGHRAAAGFRAETGWEGEAAVSKPAAFQNP